MSVDRLSASRPAVGLTVDKNRRCTVDSGLRSLGAVPRNMLADLRTLHIALEAIEIQPQLPRKLVNLRPVELALVAK